MPPPKVVPGELFELSGEYRDRQKARKFWTDTYRGGARWAIGMDSQGYTRLWRHELENDAAWKLRQRQICVRNLTQYVINSYNALIVQQGTERPEITKGSDYAEIIEDADGNGTDLHSLMTKALKMAQVQACSYLLADTSAEPGAVTAADDVNSGAVIRAIPADNVLTEHRYSGQLTSATVLMERRDGTNFMLYCDELVWAQCNVEIKEGSIIVKGNWENETAHNAGGCPLVALDPLDGLAQAEPLAEQERRIYNDESRYLEELSKGVFSRFWASGISSDELKGTGNNGAASTNNILCLPMPQASLNVIGSDPAMAAELRNAVEKSENEFWRIAGISPTGATGTGQVASGIARAFEFNNQKALLVALAKGAELAENTVIQRVSNMLGVEYPGDSHWPEEFALPDPAAEIQRATAVLLSPLPQVLKQAEAQRVSELWTLTAEQSKDLKTQIDAMGEVQAPTPTPFGNRMSAAQKT